MRDGVWNIDYRSTEEEKNTFFLFLRPPPLYSIMQFLVHIPQSTTKGLMAKRRKRRDRFSSKKKDPTGRPQQKKEEGKNHHSAFSIQA